MGDLTHDGQRGGVGVVDRPGVVSKTDQTASNSHPAAAPIAWASQSNGAATNETVPSPTVSQTEEITGTSQTPITNTSTLDERRGQTDWPTFQKK